MSKTLFITGTGTDVGKTYVTALILKKLQNLCLRAAYYKAAMSGNDRAPDGKLIPGDALYIKTVSGIDQPLEEMCPYVYETAVSPHLAAQLEGNPVVPDVVLHGFDCVSKKYDYVVLEGSGGILCPLRFDGQKFFLEDFITKRNLPCVITADAGLGTINSVVLTAEYMRSHGIPAKGIIFNHYEPGNRMHEDNLFMCEHLTGLQVLSCVRDGDTDLKIDAETLENLFL
ncbi:MAG: dethiobiotin synthase [Lachnospiraceae bacterium]|nr:dethiobiotin synthase [Lachnospiraceae bacterium]